MKLFSELTSPLVIRPNAKQLTYLLIFGALLVILQGYAAYSALFGGAYLSFVCAVLLIAAVVYHVVTVRRRARQDVTAILPPVALIGAVQILTKLLGFLSSLSDVSIKGVLFLLLESAFWVAFVLCTVRAICGQYKLIVPMLMLFFAFFYTFIKYDLRDFVSIASQVCLLLILWFPIDAVVFTSLYVKDDEH